MAGLYLLSMLGQDQSQASLTTHMAVASEQMCEIELYFVKYHIFVKRELCDSKILLTPAEH